MSEYSSDSLSFLLILRDPSQKSILQSNSVFSRSETSMLDQIVFQIGFGAHFYFQKFGTFALQKRSSVQQSQHGAGVCNSENLPLCTEHFWEKRLWNLHCDVKDGKLF